MAVSPSTLGGFKFAFAAAEKFPASESFYLLFANRGLFLEMYLKGRGHLG